MSRAVLPLAALAIAAVSGLAAAPARAQSLPDGWKLERRAGEVTLTPPGLDKIIAGQPVAPARRDQPSEPDPKAAYRTAPERGIQPSQIELVMTNMGINAALLGSGITAPRSLRPRRRERRQEQAAPSLIERCSANRRARRRS
jgi:hypothetical protein